jgi:ABC-type multidrug transport system ATPase subunit/ABC-type multidrug transport system permease subunit
MTPIPREYKILECHPIDPIVISLFGDGTIEYIYNVTANEAFVTVWSRPIGQPPFAFCNLTGCSVDGNNNMVNFRCSAIFCTCNNDPRVGNNCSNLIGYYLTNVMKTSSVLSCTPTVNPQCTLNQAELPVSVVMNCTAAECGAPAPLPTINILDQIRGIILGIVFIPVAISLCILLPLFIYYLDTKRKGKLWTEVEMNQRISGCCVEMNNIRYSLRPKSGGFSCKKKPRRIKILRHVTLAVQPGEICAVMGSSGAGKTTLLDILANYQKIGRLRGEILIDGKPVPRFYKRIVGYVTQEEALLGTLTVEEQLTYSAQLRLPGSVPYSRIKEIVADVIKDLRLEHVRNRIIGTSEKRGLSGGERRRVTIATELVTSPKILLLDEPTSGLDSYNALLVMQLLQDLAKRNCTIVCSIHQPNSEIFRTFSQLVLLWKGYVVYSGKRKHVTKFFSAFGYKCPKYENPADFVIHTINTLPDEKVKELVKGFTQWKENFFKKDTTSKEQSDHNVNSETESSNTKKKKVSITHEDTKPTNKETEESNKNESEGKDEKEINVDELKDLNSDKNAETEDTEDAKSRKKKKKWEERKYSTSWGKQLLVLSHRAAVHLWRDPVLLKAHGIITIVVALFMGLTFMNLGNDISGIQNRVGLLFFIEILFSFACLSAVDLFLGERVIFRKERANGCYRVSAYYLSKALSDLIPLRIIMPLIFGTIVYWMAGLRPDAEHFMKFLIVFLLVSLTAASLVYVISVSVPSVTVGNIVAAAIFLVLFLFGGFLVNLDSIPPYLVWIRYLSFFSYGFESLATNELQNLPLTLTAEGFPSLSIKGDVFLQAFALNPQNYWRNVGVLAGMVVGYLIIAYLVLRFARKPKN